MNDRATRGGAVGVTDATVRNRKFYDALWGKAHLVHPHKFNTWPLVERLARAAPRRVEIAAGLRPRLPLADTWFVDISLPALARLKQHDAKVGQGSITALPFGKGCFDLVCALDVVEHVADGDAALAELARVAAPQATLLLSVPLHPQYWTSFDDAVGHCRRYEPQVLLGMLAGHGFEVTQSAVFGMRPRASWLLKLGLWLLEHRRERAMWWYNRVFMPLGVHFQKPLALVDGLVEVEGVDEIFLVCRRRSA